MSRGISVITKSDKSKYWIFWLMHLTIWKGFLLLMSGWGRERERERERATWGVVELEERDELPPIRTKHYSYPEREIITNTVPTIISKDPFVSVRKYQNVTIWHHTEIPQTAKTTDSVKCLYMLMVATIQPNTMWLLTRLVLISRSITIFTSRWWCKRKSCLTHYIIATNLLQYLSTCQRHLYVTTWKEVGV